MKKWKATFQLTSAIKKGATLRGMVQLSQLGKVRHEALQAVVPAAAAAPATSRLSVGEAPAAGANLRSPPKTAPGPALQKSGPGAELPPPIFGLTGKPGAGSAQRQSALQDLTGARQAQDGAENDGNFAATFPSLLARKMANILHKIKGQEGSAPFAALGRERPRRQSGDARRSDRGESFAVEAGASRGDPAYAFAREEEADQDLVFGDKLPPFQWKANFGPKSGPKEAQVFALDLGDLDVLRDDEPRRSARTQDRVARNRRPSDIARIGGTEDSAVASARRASVRRGSTVGSGTGSVPLPSLKPSLWQMSEEVAPAPPGGAMAAVGPRSVFKDNNSKWKLLNKRIKETPPDSGQSSLGVLPKDAEVSPAPPPERPVPPEQPASVAKLASALVAHFGSLNRAYEHFDFDRKGKFTRAQFYAGCASVRLNFRTLSGLTVREIFKRLDDADVELAGHVTLAKWMKYFAGVLEGTEEADLLTTDYGSQVERRLEERRKERHLKKPGEEQLPPLPVEVHDVQAATEVLRAKKVFMMKLKSRSNQELPSVPVHAEDASTSGDDVEPMRNTGDWRWSTNLVWACLGMFCPDTGKAPPSSVPQRVPCDARRAGEEKTHLRARTPLRVAGGPCRTQIWPCPRTRALGRARPARRAHNHLARTRHRVSHPMRCLQTRTAPRAPRTAPPAGRPAREMKQRRDPARDLAPDLAPRDERWGLWAKRSATAPRSPAWRNERRTGQTWTPKAIGLLLWCPQVVPSQRPPRHGTAKMTMTYSRRGV
ncbi:Protein transport Sec1a [Durusdinium trenchii]|uniref:Protein transport Sec1a n=1 Tax=Durusdinium trenchii TaxID=1381693 RepID=A0ABP0PXD5_9DINO